MALLPTTRHDEASYEVAPHIHVSVGLKALSATGYTSHLLDAKVQFLIEMLVIEVTSPVMQLTHEPALYDVPPLRFAPANEN